MSGAFGDGGTAFPMPANEPIHSGSPGMSLRDYFAGTVLTALVADPELTYLPGMERSLATMSYVMADAMLEARKS